MDTSEKTSFAAVFWSLFVAILAPSNRNSSNWPILNAAVKNRSKKEHYLLRSIQNRSKKGIVIFAAVSTKTAANKEKYI